MRIGVQNSEKPKALMADILRHLAIPTPPVATPIKTWDFLPKGKSKDFIVSFCLEIKDGLIQPESNLRGKLGLSDLGRDFLIRRNNESLCGKLRDLWGKAEEAVAAQFRDEKSASSQGQLEEGYHLRVHKALLDNFLGKIQIQKKKISIDENQLLQALRDISIEKSKMLRDCVMFTVNKNESTQVIIRSRIARNLFSALDPQSPLAVKLSDQQYTALPFFYGNAVGQRMLFQLYRAIQMGAPNYSSRITRTMEKGEKESLPLVSNHWLNGDTFPRLIKKLIEQSSTGVLFSEPSEDDSSGFTTRYFLDNSSKSGQLASFKAVSNGKSFVADFLAICAQAYPVFLGDGINLKALSKLEAGKSTLEDICCDLITRRVCKRLLYQISCDGLLVYYSLDGINMKVAAGGDRITIKDRETNETIDSKVPICSSELRELFRHWHRLNGKVLFILFGVIVGAPWGASLKTICEDFTQNQIDSNAAKRITEIETVFLGKQDNGQENPVDHINRLWAQYALELTKKDGNQELAVKISHANGNGIFAESVRLFHSVPRPKLSPLDCDDIGSVIVPPPSARPAWSTVDDPEKWWDEEGRQGFAQTHSLTL